MKTFLYLPLTLIALFGLAGCAGDAGEVPASFVRTHKWDKDTQRLAGTLPVLQAGRVKPLETFAGFLMLRLNGKRSLKLPNGEKLEPMGFLLDCLFFPEQARDYPCFSVPNSEVLDAIEIDSEKRADRYSYRDLQPGLPKLFSLYDSIDWDHQSLVDKQVAALRNSVTSFQEVATAFDLMRIEVEMPEGIFSDVFGAGSHKGIAFLYEGWGDFLARYASMTKQERVSVPRSFGELVDRLRPHLKDGRNAPTIFPPETTVAETEVWLNPADATYVALIEGRLPYAGLTEWVGHIEAMDAARNDPTTFRAELLALRDGVRAEARRRGEYGKIASEVALYDAKLVLRALVLFLAAFVLVAFAWIVPKRKWLTRGALTFAVLGTIGVVTAVTWRAILRERPPVVNLYDTILFITGGACLISLVIEGLTRRGLGLSLAPILGAMGMFLAFRYEVKDATMKGDTMEQLQAVLDTNFWLATHVTTITLGYAAGLLAAVASLGWIVMKTLDVFGGARLNVPWRGNRGLYREYTKIVYGIICFGLLLSTVGTILGGVWGNESWGRFWGWDPKENGALLICLSQLVILHARMGGYIKQHGLHAASCLSACVVLFSWWGVNELEAGLHSYGRTEGVSFYLSIGYGLLGGMAVLAGMLSLIEASQQRASLSGGAKQVVEVVVKPKDTGR